MSTPPPVPNNNPSPAPGPGRQPFTAWVLGFVLIAGALAFLGFSSGIVRFTGDPAPWLAAAAGLLSLPFLGRWLIGRDQPWALLTAWVFLALGVLLFLFTLGVALPLIGTTALIAAAVPFGVAYFLEPGRWWPLIPTYGLAAGGGLLALTLAGATGEVLGAYALLAAALPLWMLYMLNRANVWALIPAAVVSGLGVALLVLFSLTGAGSLAPRFMVTLLITLGLVSLAVWLTARRFDWALWLAVGFGLAAAAEYLRPGSGMAWAILALSMGVYILYRLMAARRAAAAPAAHSVPSAAAAPSAPNPPSPASTPAAGMGTPPAVSASAAASGSKQPVTGFRPLARPEEDKLIDDES